MLSSLMLVFSFIITLGLLGVVPNRTIMPEPEGMVFIKGTNFHYVQRNRVREGMEVLPMKVDPLGVAYVEDYWIDLDDYYIDKTEVTNKQYKDFLDATQYRPKDPMNFLKHWTNGEYPPELENHPVVYVDFEDAKAYAQWAGKTLPTEAQWQYAAQGTDGRLFPWGNQWDSTKANVGTKGTKPVGSYPKGASPFGAFDMTGNVAEMTDSFHDDNWHWFSYIRGGSWFQAGGSVWYAENGLLTNTQRLKYWWLNPGYNRSSTIGFRCVKN